MVLRHAGVGCWRSRCWRPCLTGWEATPTRSRRPTAARAKTTLDDASSAHFVLDSEARPETGTVLVGGGATSPGRPRSRTLKVLALGSSLDLAVVSVDGTVYAPAPVHELVQRVDLRRSASATRALLDPETGISQLLGSAESAALGRSAA